jgi:hypothetical protein
MSILNSLLINNSFFDFLKPLNTVHTSSGDATHHTLFTSNSVINSFEMYFL